MKYTWKRTDNTLHGQEIEVFEDGQALCRLWVSQEATDAEIDAQLESRVEDWRGEQIRRAEMGVRE